MAGSISEFYRDKTVFIVGGTGFVGKVIVEKLVRSCDVKCIYILIRPQPGKTSQQRLQSLKASRIFDIIREKTPEKLERLHDINGDLTLKDMGLSEANSSKLEENVNIIIQAASCTETDGDFRLMVETNLSGTRKLLEFSEKIANLQAFIHVSTAFVHTGLEKKAKCLEEVLRPLPYAEEELLMTVNRLNKAERIRIAPLIKGKHKDWFSASQNYSEWAVAQSKGCPKAIIRPTSVSAVWKEPYPGFVDSTNGVPALAAEVGRGTFRRINTANIVDQIPVDVVANTVIIACWKIATQKPADVEIYQVISGGNKESSSLFVSSILQYSKQFPSSHAIWYPAFKVITKSFLFKLSTVLYHFFPALLFDFMLLSLGKKSRVMEAQKKFSNIAQHVFGNYGSRKFVFDNKNAKALEEMVPIQEKTIFYMDVENIKWTKFYEEMMAGVRKYLHDENDKTLAAARVRLFFLRLLNILFELSFYAAIWLVVTLTSGVSYVILVACPIVVFLIATFLL